MPGSACACRNARVHTGLSDYNPATRDSSRPSLPCLLLPSTEWNLAPHPRCPHCPAPQVSSSPCLDPPEPLLRPLLTLRRPQHPTPSCGSPPRTPPALLGPSPSTGFQPTVGSGAEGERRGRLLLRRMVRVSLSEVTSTSPLSPQTIRTFVRFWNFCPQTASACLLCQKAPQSPALSAC